MSPSTLLPPLPSDLPYPSLCTATVNGISEACSLIYLFIFPRPLAPTHAARGAWLRGNVCNRQHTLGITSTPFRAFRPNSCCCISLHLYLLGCGGWLFFFFLRSAGP